MIDYSPTFKEIEDTRLSPWLGSLPAQVEAGFDADRWGDLPKWIEAYRRLPDIKPSQVELDAASITIGEEDDAGKKDKEHMEKRLRDLHPWRKGPFTIFGTHIETEWRSDMKWDRLKDHIAPLKDRLILDVGSGNGYHCWRMAAGNPRLVLGIDPTLLYVVQFHVFQKYIGKPGVSVLPLGIDDMPGKGLSFDTVFSMGLLYHRRAPFDHLLRLGSFLREGGELVLETLVIDGKEGEVLSPAGRYAMMPNVWFIPSVPTLEAWLKRTGFSNIRCVDVTRTTPQEQRPTEWMGFQSLENFLDPDDPGLTIEGYPAPRRAILIAEKVK